MDRIGFRVLLIVMAFAMPTGAVPQDPYPLRLTHPIETMAELQREMGQLQEEKANLGVLIDSEGNKIYEQLYESSDRSIKAGEAVVGAFLVGQKDAEKIDKALGDSAAAARGASAAFREAREAYRSGQTPQFQTKVGIPMKVFSDSDWIPVTGSEVKLIVFGAKRRWRSYRA